MTSGKKYRRISNRDKAFYEDNIAQANSIIYEAQIASEHDVPASVVQSLVHIARAALGIRKRNIKRMNDELDESIR